MQSTPAAPPAPAPPRGGGGAPPGPAEGLGLRRVLSATDLVLLGVGVILGTGVFVVTGQAAAVHAGPAVAVSFLIAGLAAGLAALCYAELASMMPVAGSAYAYTRAALGEPLGFLVGWTLALQWLVSAALVAVGWAGYLGTLCRQLLGAGPPASLSQAPWSWDPAAAALVSTGARGNLPAVGVVLLATLVLVRGTGGSARLNRVLVAIKVATILLFVGVGLAYVDPRLWRPFLPANRGTFGHLGASGLLQGTTLVYLAFIGFDAVSTAAQEARDPRRDVPRGTLASVVACTAIYVLVALVLTGLAPYGELGVPHPLARAAEAHRLGWLQALVAGGAVVGLCSCVMGTLMAQPRILMAMSADGLMPASCRRLHPRHRTPHVATWACGAIAALLAAWVPLDVLSEMASVGTLLVFFWASVAVIVLRLRQPTAPRRFRVFGGPWGLPLASALVCCLLMAAARPAALARLAAYLGCGAVAYLVACQRRRAAALPRRGA